jgi:polysaccharide export outer membrane protein
MSEIIRFGRAARCALAFFVLWGPLAAAGVAQEQTSQSGVASPDAKQDAAKPDTAKEAVANPPAVPPVETPATPIAASAPQTSVPAPAASQAPASAPAKKAKSTKPGGSGQVTTTGVQEKPYEIGPEDYLYLNVLHQPDVSQNLEVRPDGFVSVRFAGEVKAAGLTTQQLSDSIAEKLKTYFNNPEVNIQVLKINSKKYYISGGVRKGGAYPLTAPKTIYEALIEAGGLADFAKQTKIYVLRGQQQIKFNYKEVSKGKNLPQNILLQNGDVIVVPE